MDANYRKVGFSEEIIALLNSYIQNRWSVLLWQAHAKEIARYGIITDFNSANKSIRLTCNNLRDIDFGKILYFKGEGKKIVFKSLCIAHDHNSVRVIIPNDVRLQELRLKKRFDVSANKKALLTISILSHYDSKETAYNFKLTDISEDGCCILMHSTNLVNFKLGDNVKVTHVGGDIVYSPFMANIRHIVAVKERARLMFRITKWAYNSTSHCSFITTL